MQVSDAIHERRSVRSYKSEPVPEKDLRKILDAGRWAPSSGNTQPLEFVVIGDKDRKREIAKAAFDQSFITEAPVVTVVCANLSRTEQRYGKRGTELYVIQDTAAAAQNVHLRAYSLGYGTCWVGAFREEKVSEIIEAPKGVRPLVIIPIGVPAESPEKPQKRNLDEIIHEEEY